LWDEPTSPQDADQRLWGIWSVTGVAGAAGEWLAEKVIWTSKKLKDGDLRKKKIGFQRSLRFNQAKCGFITFYNQGK